MAIRKLLVLGATGGTGQALVAQALRSGHMVTALVRDQRRLAITSDRLRVIAGDVTNDEVALTTAVSDQDVVISALGRGKSFKSQGLIAQCTPSILRAMESQGVRRLIFTSAFGVGETRRDVPLILRIYMRLLLQDIYRDKEAGEIELRRSALDWTIVYPAVLIDGPATGQYRAGERLSLTGFPRITRGDAAKFLLSQIEDTTYVRKGVLISP